MLKLNRHPPSHIHLHVSAFKRGPTCFNLQPGTQNFDSESTECGPTVTFYYPGGGGNPYTLQKRFKKQIALNDIFVLFSLYCTPSGTINVHG